MCDLFENWYENWRGMPKCKTLGEWLHDCAKGLSPNENADEFFYPKTKAEEKLIQWMDVKIIKEHRSWKPHYDDSDDAFSFQYEYAENMPFPHQNILVWVELENGKAVGWNANVSRGWSFPHMTYKKIKD